jgi:hypothetical protein
MTLSNENEKQNALISICYSYLNDPQSVDEETLLSVDNQTFFLVIRWRRNFLLTSCDWTQVSDSTANKEAWAAYRQQLRDLPSSNANPRLIVFPTPPA